MKRPEGLSKSILFLEKVDEELSRRKLEDASPDDRADVALEIRRDPRFEGVGNEVLGPLFRKTVEHVEGLLRAYRAGFDDLPREEQLALIEHACRHVNALIGATLQLVDFLELGTPKGDFRPAVKNPAKDVRAAELKDVEGLSNREVAEVLGLPPPSERAREKNDNSRVREMIKRGRAVVREAFGEEGWRAMVEEKKKEAEWWESLGEAERRAESFAVFQAESLGIPLAEARRRVESFQSYRAKELGVSAEEARRVLMREWSGSGRLTDGTS